VLSATLAVVLVGAAGATSVFLVGSKQHRDDRAAYLTYERAVLVPVGIGVLVRREMDQTLQRLRDASISPAGAVRTAGEWSSAFASLREHIVALTPPAFLGDIERRWTVAIDSYTRVPGIVLQAARAIGSVRLSLIDAAENAVKRAVGFFDRAAEWMQFHRRRLGLGPTSELPDPAATRASRRAASSGW
jgi:hypothetical protein